MVSPIGWTVIAMGLVGAVAGWQLNWLEGMWVAVGATTAVLSALIFLVGSADLAISVTVDPCRVTVGDPSSGELVVSNVGTRRLFPLRVELTVGRGAAVFDIPGLAGGQHHDELFILPTTRRSIIGVGPATSVRGDPLGLLRRAVDWTEPTMLYVHPRIARLEHLGAGFLRDLEGQPTADLSNNDVAFHTLREYQPGDDRRFVHWKTTARVGQLMIRQFVDTRRSHLAVLLDTVPASYADADEFELAVSLSASLGTRALRDEQDVTLTTGAGPLGSHDGQHLLDGLAGVELSARARTLVEQAALVNRNATGVSVVALVTGSELSLSDAHAAANRFNESVRLFVLRAHPAGVTGLKPIASAMVLNVASLDEFGHLMWKVTQG